MYLKALSSVLFLSILSTNLFALKTIENKGQIISMSTLLKNSEKVDYIYIARSGFCGGTAESFKNLWDKYNFPQSSYQDTKSIISFFNKLNNESTKKDLIVRSGFDNKNLTIIKDGNNIEYLFFDSLKSCQETTKILSEKNK
jgi:hypothetical protein